MQISSRLDWKIIQKSSWVGTHITGVSLVAPTKEQLMRKINQFDKDATAALTSRKEKIAALIVTGENLLGKIGDNINKLQKLADKLEADINKNKVR